MRTNVAGHAFPRLCRGCVEPVGLVGTDTAPKRTCTRPFSTVTANVVSSRCAAALPQSLTAKTRVLPCSRVRSGRTRGETGSKAERGEVMPVMVLASACRSNVHVSGDGT